LSSDTATIIYSYFFVLAALGAGFGILAKQSIHKHTEELKEQLNRINYALYNDGQTGLINKVDKLIENQQCIRVDVEVMKARIEANG